MKEFLNLQGLTTFLNNIKVWAVSTFRTESQIAEQIENSGFIYSTEIDDILEEASLNADTLDGHDSNYFATAEHEHAVSDITDFPTSLPASDVYSWAKAENKPSYTASEVGAATSDHTHTDLHSHGNKSVIDKFSEDSNGDVLYNNAKITTDLSAYSTTAETEEMITDKVVEIVAGAPEDFNTLKEMSDWISSHEDSAAGMNTAITNNSKAINDINTDINNVINGTTKVKNAENSDTSADSEKLNGQGADYYATAEQVNSKEPILTATQTNSLVTIEPSYEGACEVSGLVHNLLPYPYVDTTKTTSGITFTDNGDGTITINGTAETGIYANYELCKLFLKNGTYTLSAPHDDVYMIARRTDIEEYYPGTFTLTKDETIRFYLQTKKDTTFNNVIFEPMLAKSDTPQPYVPYTYEVKSRGKNLLRYPYSQTTRTVTGMTFTDNGNGSLTLNGTTTDVTFFAFKHRTTNPYTMLLTAGTYTLPTIPNTEIRALINGVNRIGTFTLDDKYEVDEIAIRIPSGATYNNLTIFPMLVAGTELGDYEPYTENTFTVTPTTDKAYVKTYDGVTNIFTDYGIPLTVNYGTTPNGAKLNEGVQANAFIHAEDFKKKVRVNKNLLDNSRFLVNQRGQSSYSDSGPTLDRWENYQGGCIINVNADGVTLTRANAENHANLEQRFSLDLFNSFKNKEATISVLTDNDLHSFTFIVREKAFLLDLENGWSILVDKYSTKGYISIYKSKTSTNTSSISIKAIKLEYGSEQTLAYKNEYGKWVLYDDYDYNADLLECQRYLRVITDFTMSKGTLGVVQTTNKGIIRLNSKVKMVANPTVALQLDSSYPLSLFTRKPSAALLPITEITAEIGENDDIVLNCIASTQNANLTTGELVEFYGGNNKIILSAEL